MSFISNVRNRWNAFRNREPTYPNGPQFYNSMVSSYRPDRVRLTRGNERSIVTAAYNRIALDVAQIGIKHVKLDDEKRFKEEMDSTFNECLTLSANRDQTGRSFMQDIVMSLFDEGCIAVIPVETDYDPYERSYKILTMRTGKIIEWHPTHVKVRAYDQDRGTYADIVVAKESVAIVENPFYAIMNEPNSTYQRLVRKLNLLDAIDEMTGSGKLDLIIQLPYQINTQARRQQSEVRRKDIEMQLATSNYGIAYIDATEHVTQLNRPVDNNLLTQITYLTELFYSQLGFSQAILDGTADEVLMLNYQNRILEPVLAAIRDEFIRKFLTPTARTQGQSIQFYPDPFKLVTADKLTDMADTYTRNEILTGNEFRQKLGMKPSDDPRADMLRNKNLNMSNADEASLDGKTKPVDKEPDTES